MKPHMQGKLRSKNILIENVLFVVKFQSPLHVEMQWLVEYGPHLDLDGSTKWVKCGNVSPPTTSHAYRVHPKITTGPYLCTCLGCKQ